VWSRWTSWWSASRGIWRKDHSRALNDVLSQDAVLGTRSMGEKTMDRDFEVVIAGFGGQGVLFAGMLLAHGALKAGRNVAWIPFYGPEMRGGTAGCTVIISNDEIGSPIVSRPAAAIVMNEPSLAKWGPRVKPGGILVINRSLALSPFERDDRSHRGGTGNGDRGVAGERPDGQHGRCWRAAGDSLRASGGCGERGASRGVGTGEGAVRGAKPRGAAARPGGSGSGRGCADAVDPDGGLTGHGAVVFADAAADAAVADHSRPADLHGGSVVPCGFGVLQCYRLW